MSAAGRLPTDLGLAFWDVPDPGTGNSINLEGKDFAQCLLTSATTETRTLPRPTRLGMYATVIVKTYGGQITLTVTGGYNVFGATTIIFTAAQQFVTLMSSFDGTNYYWVQTAGTSNPGSLFVTATATLSVTRAAHAGRIILLAPAAGAGFTSTLPTASGTGDLYRFMTTVTVTSGNNIIDAKVGGSEVISGIAKLAQTSNIGTSTNIFASASNTNKITMNGTTSGGVIGDYIALRDVAANQWILEACELVGTGQVVTPFGNH